MLKKPLLRITKLHIGAYTVLLSDGVIARFSNFRGPLTKRDIGRGVFERNGKYFLEEKI